MALSVPAATGGPEAECYLDDSFLPAEVAKMRCVWNCCDELWRAQPPLPLSNTSQQTRSHVGLTYGGHAAAVDCRTSTTVCNRDFSIRAAQTTPL